MLRLGQQKDATQLLSTELERETAKLVILVEKSETRMIKYGLSGVAGAAAMGIAFWRLDVVLNQLGGLIGS